MKKHLFVSLTIGACLLLASAGVVFAGPGGTDTGQPGSGSGVHCGTVSSGGVGVSTPGKATAPANNSSAFNGSATNPNGDPVGGNRFASSPNNPSFMNAQSAAAKNGSQYDIACANQLK
jgi:hypothetical protein